MTTMKEAEQQKIDHTNGHIGEHICDIINNHIIFSTTDLNGVIQRVSPAFCERSGYTEDELIGRTHSMLRSPDTNDSIYYEMWETIENDSTWYGEIKNIAKNGEPYWIRCMIKPLFCKDGRKVGYISVRDNITRQKEIEQCALIDEVTKIYNRRKINADLEIAIDNFHRHGTPFCLVLFDIDNFKSFNDRYGHLVGDEILIKISAFIDSKTRKSDVFARWGGDEFALLIPNVTIEDAVSVCEKLRMMVSEQVCTTLQGRFNLDEYVTLSFGITKMREGDTIDSLLGRTDRALYAAKEKGRNCVELL